MSTQLAASPSTLAAMVKAFNSVWTTLMRTSHLIIHSRMN